MRKTADDMATLVQIDAKQGFVQDNVKIVSSKHWISAKRKCYPSAVIGLG